MRPEMVTFNVTLQDNGNGEWEASVGHRPTYIYVHKKPHRAVAELVKMLQQEGMFG